MKTTWERPPWVWPRVDLIETLKEIKDNEIPALKTWLISRTLAYINRIFLHHYHLTAFYLFKILILLAILFPIGSIRTTHKHLPFHQCALINQSSINLWIFIAPVYNFEINPPFLRSLMTALGPQVNQKKKGQKYPTICYTSSFILVCYNKKSEWFVLKNFKSWHWNAETCWDWLKNVSETQVK